MVGVDFAIHLLPHFQRFSVLEGIVVAADHLESFIQKRKYDRQIIVVSVQNCVSVAFVVPHFLSAQVSDGRGPSTFDEASRIEFVPSSPSHPVLAFSLHFWIRLTRS